MCVGLYCVGLYCGSVLCGSVPAEKHQPNWTLNVSVFVSNMKCVFVVDLYQFNCTGLSGWGEGCW